MVALPETGAMLVLRRVPLNKSLKNNKPMLLMMKFQCCHRPKQLRHFNDLGLGPVGVRVGLVEGHVGWEVDAYQLQREYYQR